MIRNLMFGLSLVTLSSVSAFAAPAATTSTHHAKAKVVAQAPAGDSTAPAADKPVKKSAAKKSSKKATKSDAKSEIKSDSKMNGEAAPAGGNVETPKAK
jgi:hypothetical protein